MQTNGMMQIRQSFSMWRESELPLELQQRDFLQSQAQSSTSSCNALPFEAKAQIPESALSLENEALLSLINEGSHELFLNKRIELIEKVKELEGKIEELNKQIESIKEPDAQIKKLDTQVKSLYDDLKFYKSFYKVFFSSADWIYDRIRPGSFLSTLRDALFGISVLSLTAYICAKLSAGIFIAIQISCWIPLVLLSLIYLFMLSSPGAALQLNNKYHEAQNKYIDLFNKLGSLRNDRLQKNVVLT